MPATVILLAEVVDILPVAREARWTGLQAFESEALWLIPARHIGGCRKAARHRTAEITQKLRTAHTTKPLVDIPHDFIATRSKDVRGKPVVAAGHHAMPRLQMEVIASMQRLLAMGSDIGTEVVLIGRLVVGETGVAIEAISAVLHREMGNGVIKRGDTEDGLLYALFEVGTDGVVLGLVDMKPLAIIVGRKLTQVLQDSFGIHRQSIFTEFVGTEDTDIVDGTVIIVGLYLLDAIDHIETLSHLAKHGVLSV